MGYHATEGVSVMVDIVLVLTGMVFSLTLILFLITAGVGND